MISSLYTKKKKLGLMTHLIAGYPSIEDNIEILNVMAEKEVDIIEIQMPFSDPIADGPLFLKANQKAIADGMTVRGYFDLLSQATGIFHGPVLMMGYYNTALSMGEEYFLSMMVKSGAKGFIIPDLPSEYSREFYEKAKKENISPVQLVAPNTPDERLKEIADNAVDLLYAVARKGVTGGHTDIDEGLAAYIQRCKKHFKIPIAVGFGISTAEDIAFLRGKADIAVVGSALLRVHLEEGIAGVSNLLDEFNKKRS